MSWPRKINGLRLQTSLSARYRHFWRTYKPQRDLLMANVASKWRWAGSRASLPEFGNPTIRGTVGLLRLFNE